MPHFRVMTEVDRITEDIAHMPLAAFIFGEKETDEVNFSFNIRLVLENEDVIKKDQKDQPSRLSLNMPQFFLVFTSEFGFVRPCPQNLSPPNTLGPTPTYFRQGCGGTF